LRIPSTDHRAAKSGQEISRRGFAAAGGAAALLGAFGYARLREMGRKVPPQLASKVIGEDFPLRIVDPTGAVQTLYRPPPHVISASLTSDEILPSLIGFDRIISVTYQADTKSLSNVTGLYPPIVYRNHVQVEEMIALEPDIIVTRDIADASSIGLLIAVGIPILRMSFYDSFEGIEANIRTLAKVLGVREAGEAAVGTMRQTLARVAAAVATVKPPRTLWYDFMTHSTSGPGSLNDDTLTLAGGANVIRETGLTGYVRITPELAIALMPAVILVNSWPSGEAERDMFLSSPLWRDVPAVKSKRIHVVDSALSTTGSAYRAEGVETLARILHPGLFGDA
jgi:iron complex transport system substrate-binding protein